MSTEDGLVDFHYHYCSTDGLWTIPTPLDRVLEDMASHGIARRLVFQADESQNYASSSTARAMAGDIERSGGRLVRVDRWRSRRAPLRESFLRARTRTPVEILGVARQLRRRPGDASRGAGVLPWKVAEGNERLAFPDGREQHTFAKFHCEEDGSLLEQQFRALASSSRLLVLHISPVHLERLMEKVSVPSSCRVLMAHLGSFGCVPHELDRAVQLTAHADGLYVDTSGIHSLSVLRRYVPRFADRVVFGTDGPAFSTRAAIQVLRESGSLEVVRDNSRRLAKDIGVL